MTPATSLAEVVSLYQRWGDDNYDEDLSQLAHAEQTAARAVASGSGEALIAAALLHDVGHLLHLAALSDARHETSGPAYLGALFGPDITDPIALHVEAKRYLCAVDATYHDTLSVGSRQSLVRQGGPMTATDSAAFETQPGWGDAVQLRRWDDEGKVDGLTVAPLAEYLPLLEGLRR
ncbi:MAG: metal-dependent phosphohydrolase [Actinobacteria bacterium]|nr:metal-dependent phosphohydrolase [Actinomycetota bacterium]MBA3655354.1 metal-dependent phosphohydrolase [Actinomycetota bacterium]